MQGLSAELLRLSETAKAPFVSMNSFVFVAGTGLSARRPKSGSSPQPGLDEDGSATVALPLSRPPADKNFLIGRADGVTGPFALTGCLCTFRPDCFFGPGSDGICQPAFNEQSQSCQQDKWQKQLESTVLACMILLQIIRRIVVDDAVCDFFHRRD